MYKIKIKTIFVALMFANTLFAANAYNNYCKKWPLSGYCINLEQEKYNVFHLKIENQMINLICNLYLNKKQKKYLLEAWNAAVSFYSYEKKLTENQFYGSAGEALSVANMIIKRASFVEFVYEFITGKINKNTLSKKCQIKDYNILEFNNKHTSEYNNLWGKFKDKTILFLISINKTIAKDRLECFFTKKHYMELNYYFLTNKSQESFFPDEFERFNILYPNIPEYIICESQRNCSEHIKVPKIYKHFHETLKNWKLQWER